MSALLRASSSGLVSQRASTAARRGARPFTAAAVQQRSSRRCNWRHQAAQNDVTDEDLELLAADGEEEFYDEDVDGGDAGDGLEDAEESVAEAMGLAAIEQEFMAGAQMPEESAAYLASLSGGAAEVALAEALEGGSSELVEDTLGAAADELSGDADVAEAGLEEVEGPSGEVDEVDPLALMSNDAAKKALRVVRALKLPRDELAELVPGDWDSETVDWFTTKKVDDLPLPEFKLNFLWMDRNIAVSVDQVYARGSVSPLTEFFFWPRKDAWEELKVALEARPWISERDRVVLLNRLTEVINFWQDEEAKPAVDDAKANFPDCSFVGA